MAAVTTAAATTAFKVPVLPDASTPCPVQPFSNAWNEGHVDSCGLREGCMMSMIGDDVSLDASVDASLDASLDDLACQGRLQLPVSLDMRSIPLSPALSLDLDVV